MKLHKPRGPKNPKRDCTPVEEPPSFHRLGPPDSEFIDLAAKVLNEYIEEHGFEKWYEPNWLLAAMTGTTEQAKAKWFNDRYGAQ